jgi:hypothetical protein
MLERNATKRLKGKVQMDDAYLGGERPGRPGRGAAGKAPFVAAVETTDDGKPHQIILRRVKPTMRIDRHAALAHHLFKVAIADPVIAIPARAEQDYLDRKAATFEVGHGGLLDDGPIISSPGTANRCCIEHIP